MTTVLFACVHNAGRSQMAAAWFNELADPRKARAVSAGTSPGSRVHPEVLEAMKEVGIDLSNVAPRFLSDELAREATLLITMGCGEACPAVPGLRRADWPLEDPKGKPIARVREIRDDVKARIERLLREEGWAREGTGESVTLHPLAAADIEPVLALLARAGLPQTGVRENPGAFVVAKVDGAVVGCSGIELHGEDGLLRSVAVDPAHRHRGIASVLVRQALERSRERGLRALYLLTTTASDFFQRFAFAPCSRDAAPPGIRSSWEFQSGCPSEARLMRREL